MSKVKDNIKLLELTTKINDIREFNNLNMHFSEKDHKYYVHGINKSSVSGLLDYFKTDEEIEKFNSDEFQEFLKPYAVFGTFIHEQSELLDRGFSLDPTEYDQSEYESLLSYKTKIDTLKKQGYIIVAIELALYSNKFDICGTIDRLFYNTKNGKVLLADIKTGSTRDTHWYQQLTYASMLKEYGIEVDDIALLSLKLKNKIPMLSTLKEDKKNMLISEWSKMEKDKGK